MGSDLMEVWDNCAVADCPNKCCLRLGSEKCWPHTVGAPFNWQDGLDKRAKKTMRKKYEREYFFNCLSRS